MSEAYIVSYARTPIGRFGGSLMNLSAADLGAHAMKGALERAGIEGKELDLYIMGNVLRAGHGQLIPRQAALKAGIPSEVDGYAIDMVCSSGMMAVNNAATAIKAGEVDLVMAGGMESMSQAGFTLSSKARWGYKLLMGTSEQLQDSLIIDGLTDPIENEGMGNETERLASEYKITRDELDTVAFESHKRAASAKEKGVFQNEIYPIEVKVKKETFLLDYDEGVRPDTTKESLGKLRPAFTKDGVLTAGNSSQISDGAAALIIASENAVKKYNLKPIAIVSKGSWAAIDSWRFTEAPVPAVQKLMGKLGKKVEDFDIIENNEAFAINSVLFNKSLGIDYEKMNIYGGAIALGHPIGCSGARVISTLLTTLQENDKKLGLASLCHGTGGGTALAIERI